LIVDVVVTYLTWEAVAMNVISQPAGAIVKLNAIIKIRNYFPCKIHTFKKE
jgi:hypothetical protein